MAFLWYSYILSLACACIFTTPLPSHFTFDFSALERVDARHPIPGRPHALLVADVCGSLVPSTVSPACAHLASAPAFLAVGTACFRYGDAALAVAAALPAGDGVAISLPGGDSCGYVRRHLTVEISCADVLEEPTIVNGSIPCSYVMRARGPAGCARECPRDAAGAVCGGAARGACRLTSAGATCACRARFQGRACDGAKAGEPPTADTAWSVLVRGAAPGERLPVPLLLLLLLPLLLLLFLHCARLQQRVFGGGGTDSSSSNGRVIGRSVPSLLFFCAAFSAAFLLDLAPRRAALKQLGGSDPTCWPDYAPASARSEDGEPGRLAIIALFSSVSGIAQLPRYANYWAQSCGGQAAVADCIIVVVADAQEGGITGGAASRLPEPPKSTTRGNACAWRSHWNALAPLLFLSDAAAALFEGREVSDTLPDNVFVVSITPQDLHRRAAKLSGSTGGFAAPSAGNPRKFADYKPLYGDLFLDLLGGSDGGVGAVGAWKYSHWAWTDLDVLYGDLSRFLNLDPRASIDIQSMYFVEPEMWKPPTLSGQMTVLRNTAALTRLWAQAEGAQQVLISTEFLSFDELAFGAHAHALFYRNALTLRHLFASALDAGACYNRRDWDIWWEEGSGAKGAPARLRRVRACHAARPVMDLALLHFGCSKNYLGARPGVGGAWPARGWHASRFNFTASNEPPVWTFHDPAWGVQGANATRGGCLVGRYYF
jgi:hypothetical protein